MSEPAPPWIVFPSLRAAEPPTQGAEEAFIDLDWLPFWSGLSRIEKDDYLDRWDAPSEWRAVIAERYDRDDFDAEEDARESAAWLAGRRQGP